MKKILFAVLIALLMLPASALAKRHHVVIVKPSPQPVRVAPLAVIPPLALFYDLTRRTNCQGDVLGLGGPGFTSAITPATGNVMTTAYMRGECNAEPRSLK